jgi:ketosteroid isomerase-like protein
MEFRPMSHPNVELISRFYQAFQQLDAETMASLYTADVRFSDPVFTDLRGADAGDMWRMLCTKAQDFSLTFTDVAADDHSGRARWVATYTFSQTGNTVVNHIDASFRLRDGKICEHHDHFDLWRWSRQALGAKGLLLGWAPFVQNAIRQQAAKGLAAFQKSR